MTGDGIKKRVGNRAKVSCIAFLLCIAICIVAAWHWKVETDDDKHVKSIEQRILSHCQFTIPEKIKLIADDYWKRENQVRENLENIRALSSCVGMNIIKVAYKNNNDSEFMIAVEQNLEILNQSLGILTSDGKTERDNDTKIETLTFVQQKILDNVKNRVLENMLGILEKSEAIFNYYLIHYPINSTNGERYLQENKITNPLRNKKISHVFAERVRGKRLEAICENGTIMTGNDGTKWEGSLITNASIIENFEKVYQQVKDDGIELLNRSQNARNFFFRTARKMTGYNYHIFEHIRRILNYKNILTSFCKELERDALILVANRSGNDHCISFNGTEDVAIFPSKYSEMIVSGARDSEANALFRSTIVLVHKFLYHDFKLTADSIDYLKNEKISNGWNYRAVRDAIGKRLEELNLIVVNESGIIDVTTYCNVKNALILGMDVLERFMGTNGSTLNEMDNELLKTRPVLQQFYINFAKKIEPENATYFLTPDFCDVINRFKSIGKIFYEKYQKVKDRVTMIKAEGEKEWNEKECKGFVMIERDSLKRIQNKDMTDRDALLVSQSKTLSEYFFNKIEKIGRDLNGYFKNHIREILKSEISSQVFKKVVTENQIVIMTPDDGLTPVNWTIVELASKETTSRFKEYSQLHDEDKNILDHSETARSYFFAVRKLDRQNCLSFMTEDVRSVLKFPDSRIKFRQILENEKITALSKTERYEFQSSKIPELVLLPEDMFKKVSTMEGISEQEEEKYHGNEIFIEYFFSKVHDLRNENLLDKYFQKKDLIMMLKKRSNVREKFKLELSTKKMGLLNSSAAKSVDEVDKHEWEQLEVVSEDDIKNLKKPALPKVLMDRIMTSKVLSNYFFHQGRKLTRENYMDYLQVDVRNLLASETSKEVFKNIIEQSKMAVLNSSNRLSVSTLDNWSDVVIVPSEIVKDGEGYVMTYLRSQIFDCEFFE